MKASEITKILNEHLAQALSDGFSISYELRGSYSGVYGYTLLAKGNERVMLWLEEDRERLGSHTYTDTMSAKVGRFTLSKGERIDTSHMWPSCWGCVWERKFYNIGRARGRWYVEDVNEVLRVGRLREERWYARHVNAREKSFEITPKVLRAARKLRGFKTIKSENLKAVKRGGRYYVRNTRSGNEVRLG